jgi:hypothetical protein
VIYADLRDKEAFVDSLKLFDMAGLSERINAIQAKFPQDSSREPLLQEPS